MLDTSCACSFMMKTIGFRWDLLDRIKRNYEDWDLDKGKESGMTPKFDCVKSFMDTDIFRTLMSSVIQKVRSAKSGLTEACTSLLIGFEVKSVRKYHPIDSSP